MPMLDGGIFDVSEKRTFAMMGCSGMFTCEQVRNLFTDLCPT